MLKYGGTWMSNIYNSRTAVITCASSHNERIECLWRDVYCCVGVIFYETFYHLEDKGSLNPLNEVDLLCLHYVFLPRINKTLQEFTECWNNHKFSSEHNLTPNQLFIRERFSRICFLVPLKCCILQEILMISNKWM